MIEKHANDLGLCDMTEGIGQALEEKERRLEKLYAGKQLPSM